MKIQIASRLHLDSWPYRLPDPRVFRSARDRDVLVLAGDIGRRHDARIFVMCELPISPVIYVPGNREYHTRHPRSAVDAEWRAAAAECPGLHYLVAEGVTIDGVLFWGAPWYSDVEGDADTLSALQPRIQDFRSPYHNGGAWTLSRHNEAHRDQTERLRAQAGEVDVVITHWPPTRAGMPPGLTDRALRSYGYNDREDLVREVRPKLWISGASPACFDTRVGTTRLVGNPACHPVERQESPLFPPNKVVEVRT